MMSTEDGIVLFHPHMPKKAKEYVCDTLDSRWIGQGPKVDLFEARFRAQFHAERALTLGTYWAAQILIALSIPAGPIAT